MQSKGFGIAAIIGTATFMAALAFQYLGGLHPCQLCISQRWALGIGIASAAIASISRGGTRKIFGIAAVSGFTAEIALAVYHSGVERHFWQGPQSCSGGGSLPASFDAAALAESTAGRAPAACNEIPWELFGLSMANYNIAFAAIMTALCIAALRAKPIV